MFKNKDKSLSEIQSEYQLLILENKKLYHVINEQRVEIEGFLLEKKDANSKLLGLLANSSFEKNKKEEYIQLYLNSEEKVKNERAINDELRLRIKVLE